MMSRLQTDLPVPSLPYTTVTYFYVLARYSVAGATSKSCFLFKEQINLSYKLIRLNCTGRLYDTVSISSKHLPGHILSLESVGKYIKYTINSGFLQARTHVILRKES